MNKPKKCCDCVYWSDPDERRDPPRPMAMRNVSRVGECRFNPSYVTRKADDWCGKFLHKATEIDPQAGAIYVRPPESSDADQAATDSRPEGPIYNR